jgi:hypothetical protein
MFIFYRGFVFTKPFLLLIKGTLLGKNNHPAPTGTRALVVLDPINRLKIWPPS